MSATCIAAPSRDVRPVNFVTNPTDRTVVASSSVVHLRVIVHKEKTVEAECAWPRNPLYIVAPKQAVPRAPTAKIRAENGDSASNKLNAKQPVTAHKVRIVTTVNA